MILMVGSTFGVIYYGLMHWNVNPSHQVGDIVDELNGVNVYYNGGISHVEGRNLTQDGYNLGLKYQCVEFVKRYYYEFYGHKMPDSYGHAIAFFDQKLQNGQLNESRGLMQYANGTLVKPQEGDLVVYTSTLANAYGHVAIVSAVRGSEVEIIQQNPGPFGVSREVYPLSQSESGWRIEYDRILGFLRLQHNDLQ